MPAYENEFSAFPSKLITKHDFRNVDDNIAPIINQINSLREKGLYNQAARLIQANKDVLPHYIVDAATFRTWEEEIFNAQKYAKLMQQIVYVEEDEPDCLEGYIWLGR